MIQPHVVHGPDNMWAVKEGASRSLIWVSPSPPWIVSISAVVSEDSDVHSKHIGNVGKV